MQPGRLLAKLIRRTGISSSCDHCWAGVEAASNSWSATAATAPAVPTWSLALAALAGQRHALSTATPQSMAAAAAAEATAAAQPASTPAGTSSSKAAEQQQRRRQQQQHSSSGGGAGLSFDELREQYQQQLKIRNSQGEDKLLALVQAASSGDQVSAAVDLLRWDRANRARLHQMAHISTRATRALLRAGSQAGLGPAFAVQVLQEANELGLQVSLVVCEEVLEACIKQQDYWRAAEAWVYTRAYCAGGSSEQPTEAAGAAAHEGQPTGVQQQQQRTGASSELAWANNSILRLYATGLAGWLQQGCVDQEHEQYVQQQLKQLVQELEGRGAAVPARLQQAASAAGGSQPVEEDKGSGHSGEDQESDQSK